ncbi:MAG: PEGA domain-containing protein [Acidobacteria bacterium]|nr:PEGA domain-containing protein [Acidobacteriota bacterium]
MQRLWKAGLIALLAILILVPGGFAHAFDRAEGFERSDDDFHVFIGPDFYPGFYGLGGWGWFNPWYGGVWNNPWYGGWYSPWYDQAWHNSHHSRRPRSGDVKIITKRKHASVYVDGGYVGRAGRVNKLPLSPGSHMIQLRTSSGRTFYQKRVYVVPGKTIKLHAKYSRHLSRAEPAYGYAAPAVPRVRGRSKAPGGNG